MVNDNRLFSLIPIAIVIVLEVVVEGRSHRWLSAFSFFRVGSFGANDPRQQFKTKFILWYQIRRKKNW